MSQRRQSSIPNNSLLGAQTRLPSIRRRLASMLYECLLLLGVLSVAFMLPHLALGIGLQYVAPGQVLLAHLLLVLFAYFYWFWRHGGQTLAMQTWKLRLESAVGYGNVSMLQAVLRFALCIPSLLFFGVGVLWAIFDRDRQFLHDRLAGTRIVMVV